MEITSQPTLMVHPVYLTADSVLTPLGAGTENNLRQMWSGATALRTYSGFGNFNTPFCAGIIPSLKLLDGHTRLESMLIHVLDEISESGQFHPDRADSLLIIATTKGNIDVLETGDFPAERAYLPVLGKMLQTRYSFANAPVVLSNACVSGVSAITMAQRLIASDRYAEVTVCSADVVSEFVLSGFHSFNALSPEPCRPFDKDRQGINLGEAAAAAVFSKNRPENAKAISQVMPGFGSNDANHISGPSRSGEGLYRCLEQVMRGEDVPGFISAHGTATLYNDEMEAIAFQRAGLETTPLHSLKGYFGHTLGSAGLLEFVLSNASMHNNRLIASPGYAESGVSVPAEVIREPRELEINSFLKTASGFGGTNGAILCRKI